MAEIPKDFGTGGSGLNPGQGDVSLVDILNDLADDVTYSITSPVAVAAAAADATDLATAQTLVNELKTKYNVAVTLLNEIRTDLNAAKKTTKQA